MVALSRGRVFPILGRRGLTVAAMSGVDMALWDLLALTRRSTSGAVRAAPTRVQIQRSNVETIVARAIAWPNRLKPSAAGEVSGERSRCSVSTAWTTKK